MSTITLNNGNKMPQVGFGLWKVPKEEASDVVYNALKNGYRLVSFSFFLAKALDLFHAADPDSIRNVQLDGAADYGNEKECGQGLARAIKDGIVKREEVWVVSKIWNTNHAYDHAIAAAKNGLKLWGVDYFDLLLIHFPVSLQYVDPSRRYPPEWWDGTPGGKVTLSDAPIHETWKAMEKIHADGLAKNIGVSNFAGGLLCDLMRYAKTKPSVLQIEQHPYLVQEELMQLCKTFELAVTAYSTFGPQSFLELSHGRAMKTVSLFEHDTIKSIAKNHNRTVQEVLLRWCTQRGIAVIPKSNNPDRAVANLKHVEFDLKEEEIKQISGLDTGLRFNNPIEIDPRLGIFA